jgi:hypothetical protein
MKHKHALKPKQLSKTLLLFAGLLEDRRFIALIRKLESQPEERRLAKKDPKVYFRKAGFKFASDTTVAVADVISLCVGHGTAGNQICFHFSLRPPFLKVTVKPNR